VGVGVLRVTLQHAEARANSRITQQEPKGDVKTQRSNSLPANIRINVDEIYELRHWAKQLGVSIDQLRTAIEQVGPLIDAIRQHLKDEMNPNNSWYPRAGQP
jgi:hypothetical protein